MTKKHDKAMVGEQPAKQDAPPVVMALALPPAELSEPMQAYFAKCEEKLGYVPNVLIAYAHDDAKLQAFAAFYNDLMLAPSGLSKLEREMIAVAVSSVNRCYYCLSAHGAAVRQLSTRSSSRSCRPTSRASSRLTSTRRRSSSSTR